jgi:hypothetical protein
MATQLFFLAITTLSWSGKRVIWSPERDLCESLLSAIRHPELFEESDPSASVSEGKPN